MVEECLETRLRGSMMQYSHADHERVFGKEAMNWSMPENTYLAGLPQGRNHLSVFGGFSFLSSVATDLFTAGWVQAFWLMGTAGSAIAILVYQTGWLCAVIFSLPRDRFGSWVYAII